jgi:hypothetical protein
MAFSVDGSRRWPKSRLPARRRRGPEVITAKKDDATLAAVAMTRSKRAFFFRLHDVAA